MGGYVSCVRYRVVDGVSDCLVRLLLRLGIEDNLPDVLNV